MKTNEVILKKIRKALVEKSAFDYLNHDFDKPLFPENEEDLEFQFATQFIENGGNFIYCENQNEIRASSINIRDNFSDLSLVFANERIKKISGLSDPKEGTGLRKLLISDCELLVSRTGSIVMSSYLFDQKPPLSEIDAMLIIANSSQVVKDIGNAFKLLRGKYKKNTPHTFFVSGPSKTADVEQKTIVGVHGPSSLFLLLTDNSNYGI